MTRLTKKKVDHYVYIYNVNHNIGEHVEKLGQLEDIEEKLGIELNILLKDVHSPVDFIRKFRVGSVWIKNRYKNNNLEKADLNHFYENGDRLDLMRKDDKEGVFGYYREKLSNYGITRALTKEELE